MVGQRDLGGEGAVEGINKKVKVGCRAIGFAGRTCGAVGSGECACGGLHVAVAQVCAHSTGVNANPSDAVGSKGSQLVGLTDAVLVQVAPDAQIGKNTVGRVDLAVFVGIQVFECVKTIGRQLTIALECVNTEELTARVDGAVAIAIQHQPAVIRLDPAGTGFDTIGIVVEQDDCAIAGARGFDAVAVQVQNQRVASRGRGSACACTTTSAARATSSTTATAGAPSTATCPAATACAPSGTTTSASACTTTSASSTRLGLLPRTMINWIIDRRSFLDSVVYPFIKRIGCSPSFSRIFPVLILLPT